MARKKVNTKFIWISLVVLGVVGLLAGGAWKWHQRHQNPSRLLAIADESMAQGKYDVAAQHYFAAGQRLHDPSLMVKGGDVYYGQGYADTESIKHAASFWNEAITLDPTYQPALVRLVDHWRSALDIGLLRSDVFEALRRSAEKLHNLDPSNKDANAAIALSTLRAWISGIETEPQKVQDAAKAVADLQAKDPDNAELPFYLSVATLQMAQKGIGENSDVKKVIPDATAIMEAALKRQDANAITHFYAFRFYSYLQSLVPEAERAKLRERQMAEINRAAELAKPEQPLYGQMIHLAAQAKLSDQKPAEAEKILKNGLAAKPSDLEIRRALAETLAVDPARREEAMQVLATPVTPTAAQQSGWYGPTYKSMEEELSIDLALMRLSKYMALKGDPQQEQQRAQLLNQAEQTEQKIVAKYPNRAESLRLQGRLQQVKGQLIEATQTYDRAVKGATSESSKLQMSVELANLYLQTEQLGAAEALLRKVVEEAPQIPIVHRLLIETYLRENKPDEAKPFIEKLSKLTPDAPELSRYRLATLDPAAQKDQIAKQYQQLPEQNRQQRLEKASIAARVLDNGDAPRLLQLILKDDPGDVDAAISLARYFESKSKGDNSQALAVLDSAIKAAPDAAFLKLEKQRLSGAKPEEREKTQLDLIANLPPLDRELAMYEWERRHNNLPAAAAHAREAEKIAPKDQRPLEALMNYAISQKDWNTAEDYVNRLSQPDVNGDRVGGLLYRWKLALAQGDMDKALTVATRLTREKSEFAQSYLALGKTQQAMGKYDDAIFNLNLAKERQPTNPEIYGGLIDSSYALNRPAEAKKYLDEAKNNLRGQPVVDEWTTRYELRFGDPEKVLAQRQDALKQHPDDVNAYLSLGSTYAALGERRREAKKDAEASDAYNKARDVFQQGLQKFPGQRDLVNNYAGACLALKDFDAGERVWKEMLARDEWKDKPQGLVLLADYYIAAGPPKLPQAEQTLRDALAKTGGNNVDLQLRLVNVLLQQNKPDDALTVLSSTPANADDPRIVGRKVDILISPPKPKWDQAEQALNTALTNWQQKNQPVPAEMLNSLSLVYMNTNKWPQALQVVNKVLSADPKNPVALTRRAMITASSPQANLDDAVKDLLVVRETNPKMLDARYLLAELYGRKHDQDARTRELEGILSSDPTQRPARLMLLEAYSNAQPPKWTDVERLLNEARNQPNAAKDVTLLDIEAKMWARRGDPKRAIEKLTLATNADPTNTDLLRTFYGLMLDGTKEYQKLLALSENLPPHLNERLQDKWWFHRVRGAALARLKNRDAALKEFGTALEQTFATNDNGGAEVVVTSMQQDLGADAVLAAIAPKLEAGDNRWRIVATRIYLAKHDVPTARKTIDLALADLPKLPPGLQAQTLAVAGTLYMYDPDPDLSKAKDLYLQLVKLRPDDFQAWNNLASNKLIKPEESVQYSQKAYDAMQRANVVDPNTTAYVKDTHGWNLVQVGRVDEGMGVLLEAWQSLQFPDLAYHLGMAFLKQNKPDEAEKYLAQANELFGKFLEQRQVTDMKLQDDINAALKQAKDLKVKLSNSQ